MRGCFFPFNLRDIPFDYLEYNLQKTRSSQTTKYDLIAKKTTKLHTKLLSNKWNRKVSEGIRRMEILLVNLHLNETQLIKRPNFKL